MKSILTPWVAYGFDKVKDEGKCGLPMAFWDDSLLECISSDNKRYALLARIGNSDKSRNEHALLAHIR